jgi:hypothetical protein
MSTKKNKRQTVKYSNRFFPKDKSRFQELMNEFDCTQAQVMEYLISLESSKVEKGQTIAEQKLKQWLFLGYPKKITPNALRYADYGVSENAKGEIKTKEINLNTAKKLCELYATEIDEHNSKIND